MPVLINKETGQAEQVSSEDYKKGLEATHEMPVLDQQGNFGSVPVSEYGKALQQGYKVPPPADLQKALDKTKYEAPIEQAKTFGEGVGQGVLGPIFTGTETALGGNAREQRKRAEINPGVHTAGELSGMVGSSLVGVGELPLLEKAGLAATKALGTTGKVTTKAAQLAIESALFQTGDEISKKIQDDPSQSAESAIANIGIAGLLGGAGGAALGGVSKGWSALAEGKAGQFVSDFKSRIKGHLENPEPVKHVSEELSHYYNGIKDMADDVYGASGLKAQEISKVVPEMNDKMTAQVNTTLETLQNSISKMEEKPNVFPQRLTEKLRGDLAEVADKTSKAQTSSELFNAVQELKQKTQAYSKFDKFVKPVDEAYDFVQESKKLSHGLREALEDSSVWGKAADRQKAINKAFVEFKGPLEDFERKFTTEVNGERVIDPTKMNTYVNQLGKPNAELKQEMLRNFVEAADKYKKTLDVTHSNLGLESPNISNALTATRGTLEEMTPGARAADALIKRGLSQTLGEGAGLGLGTITGHPILGYMFGKNALEPLFRSVLPALSRAILENPTSGAGFESAVKVGLQIVRGERALDKATKSVFDAGSFEFQKVAANDRDKIKKQLGNIEDKPEGLLAVGSSAGQYLPGHAAVLAGTASRTTEYLNSLRPSKAPIGPLDDARKPSAVEEARYNNAIDIAQNPLMVMKHVKEGSVTTQDLQDLSHMYPGLYKNMQSKLFQQMVDHKDAGKQLPYKTKIGLSMFLASPLDATMQPAAIQANQRAPAGMPNVGQQSPDLGQRAPHNMNKLDKLPGMYTTPQQQRTMFRGTGRH